MFAVIGSAFVNLINRLTVMVVKQSQTHSSIVDERQRRRLEPKSERCYRLCDHHPRPNRNAELMLIFISIFNCIYKGARARRIYSDKLCAPLKEKFQTAYTTTTTASVNARALVDAQCDLWLRQRARRRVIVQTNVRGHTTHANNKKLPRQYLNGESACSLRRWS